jgi:hypothetical protein
MRLQVVAITVTAILGASLSDGFQVNDVHHPRQPPSVVVSSKFSFVPREQQHRDLKSTQLQSEQSIKQLLNSIGASPGYRVSQEYETESSVSINMDNIDIVNPIDEEGAVLYQVDDWEGKYGDQDLELRLEDVDQEQQEMQVAVNTSTNQNTLPPPGRPPSLELLQSWTQEYLDAIDLAGGMTRISMGVEQYLADEYVHTTPDIGPLGKNDYIQLMRYWNYNGLDSGSAIPDLTVEYTGWHVDPHNPWRIWAIARYAGTHTGLAVDPDSGLKLSPSTNNEHKGVRFTTGPELQSFLWNPNKTLRWQTNGFVGDDYTGSNQGKGGLKGLLISMGLPRLFVQATEPLRNAKSWMSQFKGSKTSSSSSSGQQEPSQTPPRSKSPYSSLPQWWHYREEFNLNIHL